MTSLSVFSFEPISNFLHRKDSNYLNRKSTNRDFFIPKITISD